MKNATYALFFLIFFFSCQSNNPQQDTLTTLFLSTFEKTDCLQYGDKTFFSDCQVIPLELTDNSMIARISRIEVHGDRIYLLDKGAGKLFVFDINGKYIKCISRKGEAGDEYVAISGFFIHPEKETIHIIDPLKKRVLHFTLDGTFINATNHTNPHLGFLSQCMVIENDQLFCRYSTNLEGDNPLYNVLDLNTFEIVCEVENHLFHSPLWTSLSPSKDFHRNEKGIILGKMFSDTIYTYKDCGLLPTYRIDYKKNIPYEILKNRFEDFDYNSTAVWGNIMREDKYNPGFPDIIETSNYLYGHYHTSMEVHSFIWDKQNEKGYISDNLIYQYAKDNLVIDIWEPDYIDGLKELLSSDHTILSGYHEELISLIKDYQPDEDNPVLIFYYLK